MSPRAQSVTDFGLVAAAFVMTALTYARLPALVPSHFDVHGQVDGTLPREIGAWLLPGILLVSTLARRYFSPPSPAAKLVSTVAHALLLALHAIVLLTALGTLGDPAVPLAAALSVMLLASGLLLPRVRRNRLVGIRLPSTLASDENWSRAQRFGGHVFFAAGSLALVLSVLGAPTAAHVAIFLAVIATVAYGLSLRHA